MKDNTKKRNSSGQIHLRVSSELKKQIKTYAQEEEITENAVITMALQKFFTDDINDESLLIAKMQSIDSKLYKLISKTDLGHKYLMDFFQYNFLFFPPLPEDTRSLKIKYAAAGQSFSKFMLMFRKRIKTMPNLEETILGDMAEKPSEKGNK